MLTGQVAETPSDSAIFSAIVSHSEGVSKMAKDSQRLESQRVPGWLFKIIPIAIGGLVGTLFDIMLVKGCNLGTMTCSSGEVAMLLWMAPLAGMGIGLLAAYSSSRKGVE